MNIRSFVRGGYRTVTEPTDILVGQTVIGRWVPDGYEPVVVEQEVQPTLGSASRLADVRPVEFRPVEFRPAPKTRGGK